MRVALSPEARADLKAVARWIAADNLERAESFSRDLRLACASWGRHPLRFPIVRRLGKEEIRKHLHGRYLIFYRVREDRVEILRILHGARGWASLLADD